jgi:hypothetical protein
MGWGIFRRGVDGREGGRGMTRGFVYRGGEGRLG